MASSSTIQLLLTIAQQYTIYTSIIIFVIGLIGNLLNILTFTKLQIFRNNQCIFYLLVESIVDFNGVIYNFTLRLLTMIYGSDLSQFSTPWCKFRTMMGQAYLLISLSTICFAAIDQFLSTSHLIFLRQMSTLKLARHLVIVSICFSLVHSIGFGVFYNAKPFVDCLLSHPALVRYYSYFFYPMLCGILPIFISGSISLLAYRNVRRIVRRQLPIVRRRLDRQLTKFVLVRVVFLVIFLGPFVIYRIYTINSITKPPNPLRAAIERLVQAFVGSMFGLHFAGNFYIFLASSSRYRRQVKYVLIKEYWNSWKRRFHFNNRQIEPVAAPTISSNELE
ncbi:unnamed protein product [Rotaria sp. Silwood2]|nr:unnamed protein product [Rotaria sp. Silwood2]CAF2681314.1 unnamed protein product [Rotaria sp. Silwood2]CAF2954416.1 unnamed protein product [Rotaria sp. Silwood2]CAF4126762.1 unnamed protein product [Rotaria sp. Silwood2]CAF4194361.1 unnamed protein product [Rotaria sp. Silwood2]